MPGRESAPLETMGNYPASVLKLMVSFGVLQMVDKGEIGLDDVLAYTPANTSCGAQTTKPVRAWFDEMITISDNRATCALIKMLHDHNKVDALNAKFASLGLGTLQLTGTNPTTGGTWLGTSMTSLDTARLLLLVNGSPGVLWKTPTGEAVTANNQLSWSSRKILYKLMSEQGLNAALSTTNWCGRAYPAAGIPAPTHKRWVNPVDGTVSIEGRVYGQDVRPCNAAAEVTFAHKTGLTNHGGADAGIVHSIPGKGNRHYIVVFMSNLGARFSDIDKPADPPGIYPVPYTQKIGQLGKAIDDIVKSATR